MTVNEPFERYSRRTSQIKTQEFRWISSSNVISNRLILFIILIKLYLTNIFIFIYSSFKYISYILITEADSRTVQTVFLFNFWKYLFEYNEILINRCIFGILCISTKYRPSLPCLFPLKAASESSRVLIFYTPPNFQSDENFP